VLVKPIVILDSAYITYIYKSLFATQAATRQTDRYKMIQRLHRKIREKNAVHDLSTDSPYVTELVEHDILWTNDDLRQLSSVPNAH